MKLLVLGAGATGGYFGGRLAEAGVDVTFLVRERRREQLQQDGLRVRSELGDLRLAVKTVTAAALRPAYDIVLLTCKSYDLESALDAISPVMTGACAVLPLMNGMAHFPLLDERFGQAAVMGGTCAIYATLDREGVIHHNGPLQRLIFGERPYAASARARALADALSATKIDWELSKDIQQNLWEKIVLLGALAAATCLFRGNVGEVMAAPGGRETVVRLLDANVEIATREGYPPRAAALEFARRALMDPWGTRSASILHDIEAGHSIESDHIIGWMLEKARNHRVDDTILSLAYTHLKTYEARRAKGRLPGVI